MNKLLVILGPTAAGKTDVALNLAEKFNGELVSCDSRQVYVDLDIGSGKLPSGRWKMEDGRWKKGEGYWEIDGVNIWMYDVVSPKVQYTVADYVKEASNVIEEVIKKGKLPIVVGGTGLYLKALLEGFSNLAIPPDFKLRRQLEKLSTEKLQKKLQNLSLVRWKNLNQSDRQNSRRLIRAIELVILSETKDLLRMQDNSNKLRDSSLIAQNDVLKIGLTAPREVLYKRADERVISRIQQGMISEAKKLQRLGLSLKRMNQLGLEYGVLAGYLKGNIKHKEELIKVMQGKIHGFIRRQLTWFKKEKNVSWFNITTSDYLDKIEKATLNWYNQK